MDTCNSEMIKLQQWKTKTDTTIATIQVSNQNQIPGGSGNNQIANMANHITKLQNEVNALKQNPTSAGTPNTPISIYN